MGELRTRALASWGRILEHPATWMNAEQQYHELLKVADKMEIEGLISDGEIGRASCRERVS